MWTVSSVRHNPMQSTVALVNEDLGASVSTDYQAADALARRTLGAVSLYKTGYNLSHQAMRLYASQMY